jgi:entericidin B
MIRMLVAVLIASFALAGCNTMEGLGKDIQHGGEKLQGAAERHKN